MTAARFEIFLATAPGLESVLVQEALERGFLNPRPVAGGVTFQGGWPHVWRANLELRCASRVLARVASFKAAHLSQLERATRRIAWSEVLRSDEAFRVEATCSGSLIYHSDAASESVARGICATLGAKQSEAAPVAVRVRIEADVCTISVDTSGALLHKRGHKLEVNKAPIRETIAAGLLRLSGYDRRSPVLDPMCGSGTFVIEAAEMAANLVAGRDRNFAFEYLSTFDAEAYQAARSRLRPVETPAHFYGFDQDAGAVRMSKANADRAGVAHLTSFETRSIKELHRPAGEPGLIIVNPPYGGRLGENASLAPLYRSMGQKLAKTFSGWRAAIVTSDEALAQACGLTFASISRPVSHGGLRVRLYATAPLP